MISNTDWSLEYSSYLMIEYQLCSHGIDPGSHVHSWRGKFWDHAIASARYLSISNIDMCPPQTSQKALSYSSSAVVACILHLIVFKEWKMFFVSTRSMRPTCGRFPPISLLPPPPPLILILLWPSNTPSQCRPPKQFCSQEPPVASV